MEDGYHLSLGLSRELWEDLLRAALPVRLSEGRVDVVAAARAGVRQLGVRERISGLIEDRGPRGFHTPLHLRRRTRAVLRRQRERVVRRARQVVHVDGSWRIILDDAGTHLRYGRQQVGADAWVKGIAEGTLYFLRENVEVPFGIERRIGASVTLGDIHYDKGSAAVIGSLQDLALHVGERAVWQLLARAAEAVLHRQLDRVNPVPILRRDQVEEMVGPMGGAFRVKMGVEDLALVVTDAGLTLKVRFGFTQSQLPGREAAGQLEG